MHSLLTNLLFSTDVSDILFTKEWDSKEMRLDRRKANAWRRRRWPLTRMLCWSGRGATCYCSIVSLSTEWIPFFFLFSENKLLIIWGIAKEPILVVIVSAIIYDKSSSLAHKADLLLHPFLHRPGLRPGPSTFSPFHCQKLQELLVLCNHQGSSIKLQYPLPGILQELLCTRKRRNGFK